jgi:hypothetical protein
MGLTFKSPTNSTRTSSGNKDPRNEYNPHSNYSGNVVNRTPAPDYSDRNNGDGGAAAKKALDAKIIAREEANRVATEKAKAKALADRIANAKKTAQQAKDKRALDAKIAAREEANRVATEKAASKAKNKEDIISARDRRDYVPVGSAWSTGSPNELSRDPLERLERSSGRGMGGRGEAFYPTGFAEGLEDNMPSGWGKGLLGSPMASIASTVGKTFYNQGQYGMNEEAAELYKELIADPANEGKTVQELVQMARQPQKDKQKSNAFINDETGSTATEAQLDAMRPFIKDLNMSDAQWSNLSVGMKRSLASGTKVNTDNGTISGGGGGGGGGLLGRATTSVEPEVKESTYTNLDSYLKLFNNDKY